MLQCFQFFFFFCDHKKLKNPPSKVAHNRPKPFLRQSSPGHSQQPRSSFPFYKKPNPNVSLLVSGVSPPDFGRSVNPISSRGEGVGLCPPHYYLPLGFSDLPTVLGHIKVLHRYGGILLLRSNIGYNIYRTMVG